MNILKVSAYFLLYFFVSACTSNQSLTSHSSDYYGNNFPQNKLISTVETSQKKPASSDHQLMLSLLNRETPQDQLMMLAFASRASHDRYDNKIGILIKGPYLKDTVNYRVKSKYINLIEEDNNAVGISLMAN
jgi:hypothetical protein